MTEKPLNDTATGHTANLSQPSGAHSFVEGPGTLPVINTQGAESNGFAAVLDRTQMQERSKQLLAALQQLMGRVNPSDPESPFIVQNVGPGFRDKFKNRYVISVAEEQGISHRHFENAGIFGCDVDNGIMSIGDHAAKLIIEQAEREAGRSKGQSPTL